MESSAGHSMPGPGLGAWCSVAICGSPEAAVVFLSFVNLRAMEATSKSISERLIAPPTNGNQILQITI